MVEYLIIFPTLILLVLGAVQFGLLYQIKSQVNYATFLAARQGALKNGNTSAIKDAFGAGMTPLFTYKPDLSGLLRGRAIGMVEAFNPLVTKIERVSPPDSVAKDFWMDDPNPSNSSKILIPNDNLQYRDTSIGTNSLLNIQDANILKIRVTYCAKLIVPIANVAIYSLVNAIEGTKNLTAEFFSTPVGPAAKTPNMCSALKDQYGSKVQSIVSAGNSVGVDLSFMSSLLTSASTTISGMTVPGIDWVIGGYRIPVTSEAVVRMQTPLRLDRPN